MEKKYFYVLLLIGNHRQWWNEEEYYSCKKQNMSMSRFLSQDHTAVVVSSFGPLDQEKFIRLRKPDQ